MLSTTLPTPAPERAHVSFLAPDGIRVSALLAPARHSSQHMTTRRGLAEDSRRHLSGCFNMLSQADIPRKAKS